MKKIKAFPTRFENLASLLIENVKFVLKYRKCSIRSQPCIILDLNFPRLLIEVI